MPRSTLLIFILAASLAFAGGARAAPVQLALPDRAVVHRAAPAVELPKPGGDLAPKLDPATGNVIAAEPKLALPSTSSPPLPGGPVGPAGLGEPAPAEAAPSVPAPLASGPLASSTNPLPGPAPAFVLAEIAKLEPDELHHPLLGQAERGLLALGDEGLAAARGALYSDHPPTVVLAARVLLRSGRPAEAELVARRLAERLPNAACVPVFDALVELDPVRASPAYLAELLGHPQAALRSAAERALEAQSGPAILAPLLGALEHERSDTRLRAVGLVAGVRDPAVLPLLLGRLRDPSTAVAARAVASLAVIEDERVANELVRRAFGMRWILREGAYALLAILEREDRQLVALLDESHVEPLLEGLGAADLFVAGTSAAALAGLGFRSELDCPWLDRSVPHQLVRAVGGEEFHDDASALQPVAQRRLALITGENFGSSGPRWRTWWAEHAEGFRARRAVLGVTPAEAGLLEVGVRTVPGPGDGFLLVGPRVATPAVGPRPDLETVLLTEAQARELYAVLEREGVFGLQRLPGLRGDAHTTLRELEVRLGEHQKLFAFAAERSEDWFERVLAAAEAVREVDRWQRFLPGDPADAAGRRARWALEAPWWEGEADERARDLRCKELVLEHLAERRPSERDAGVAELARLAERGRIEAADFKPLVELLRGEFFIGPRARVFLAAALDAARAAGVEGAPAPDLARELVDALLDGFGSAAAREVSQVLAAAGRGATLAAAADSRAFVRAVAAATLAEGTTAESSAEDWAVLSGLLADEDPEVEIAAVLALGEQRVEAARTELLVRARVADPPVRAAALEAVGHLGGEGAFDALLVALAERDQPEVVAGAARGLVQLGDPAAAPLFVSILAKGSEHPAFEAARTGLERLGPAAHEALWRAVQAPEHKARREAALLLARAGEPKSASVLMSLLTESPDDVHVAEELAILTCVDLRTSEDPALAWWQWWDLVVHDDAHAWLFAELERAGVAAPAAGALDGAGTREGALYLFAILERNEAHLVERARRELERLLATESASSGLGPIPSEPSAREAWLRALRQRIDAGYK